MMLEMTLKYISDILMIFKFLCRRKYSCLYTPHKLRL